MKHFYLGVDAGGTKSHALIADAQGHALGFGVGGPGNPNTIGFDAFRQCIGEIVEQAMAEAHAEKQALAGAAFGVGGYDWDSEQPILTRALEPLGLNVPLDFFNDAALGIPAGTKEGWGVAVVSGSGSNCRGWDRHRTHIGRVSGYGVRMAEGAGASEMTSKILQALSRAWSRRGPATRLTQTFIELTHARDEDDLIEGLCMHRYRLPNKESRVVFDLAAQGDMVARELVEWAGCELGSLAVGVIRQLGFEARAFELVMVGSFFNGSPVIAEKLGEVVHAVAPRARLVRLLVPPVVGAVMLAMERAKLRPPLRRKTLIRTTQELLDSRLPVLPK